MGLNSYGRIRIVQGMRLTRIKHDFQTQPCSGITGGGAGFIGFRDWDLGLFGLGCFMRWVIGLHRD